jgi:protein subunit release factor A
VLVPCYIHPTDLHNNLFFSFVTFYIYFSSFPKICSLSVHDRSTISREWSELSQVVELSGERNRLLQTLSELEELGGDASKAKTWTVSTEDEELAALAAEEWREMQSELMALESRLLKRLAPRDPDDGRGALLEVC